MSGRGEGEAGEREVSGDEWREGQKQVRMKLNNLQPPVAMAKN